MSEAVAGLTEAPGAAGANAMELSQQLAPATLCRVGLGIRIALKRVEGRQGNQVPEGTSDEGRRGQRQLTGWAPTRYFAHPCPAPRADEKPRVRPQVAEAEGGPSDFEDLPRE